MKQNFGGPVNQSRYHSSYIKTGDKQCYTDNNVPYPGQPAEDTEKENKKHSRHKAVNNDILENIGIFTAFMINCTLLFEIHDKPITSLMH